jgi:hypothetical protein
MFYFNRDEIDSILSSQADNVGAYFSSVFTKVRNQYKPLFFTPYRSGCEFASELVAPVIDPLRLAGITAASALAAVIAAAAALGALLVTSIATLCMNTKIRDTVWDFTCNAVVFLASALITAATCLFLSIASIPHGLASLLTRSATTVKTVLSPKEEQGLDVELLPMAPN